MLRSRAARSEDSLEEYIADRIAAGVATTDPEQEVLLADSIGPALLAILDLLSPAERLSFVLHDMFAMPFEEIAPVIGRSVTAARQLASHARRRMQGADDSGKVDRGRQCEVVETFLAASRNGDFAALLEVLDPEVVLRADHAAVQAGATAEVRGVRSVAETFRGRARAAQLALIDGEAGALWTHGGQPRVVFSFVVVDEKIVEIELFADADRLREFGLKRLVAEPLSA
jgi:hypothetical protein